MKFSLCLPVSFSPSDQKRPRMLIECLDSILQQTHTDFEVILKDSSEFPVTTNPEISKIVKNFGPKLTHLIAPDNSIFSGLNQALRQSVGDILHFICGDDRLGNKGTLAYVNALFETRSVEEPTWLYGSVGTILEDGSEGHWAVTPFAALPEILIHNRMGQPATFWNRAMFQRIGYFQYTLAGDYDYWCRCYRIAAPLYTTRILGVGRRWSESATHKNIEKTEFEALEISKKHSESTARGEKPIYVQYEER